MVGECDSNYFPTYQTIKINSIKKSHHLPKTNLQGWTSQNNFCPCQTINYFQGWGPLWFPKKVNQIMPLTMTACSLLCNWRWSGATDLSSGPCGFICSPWMVWNYFLGGVDDGGISVVIISDTYWTCQTHQRIIRSNHLKIIKLHKIWSNHFGWWVPHLQLCWNLKLFWKKYFGTSPHPQNNYLI